ncbi:MAG TPA: DNA repair exonuclease [Actinospica sp.]|jgi:DNA repair exonuclease SbcCD nuclease subunit|nr:DNA repair exonuclease [Actinospica sp.]
MKFLHAADLHIDSPLRGLERLEDAPTGLLRGATRRAMENLVALAREERVDAVLLAGDVYDGDWKDFETALFFRRQLGRLQESGIRVYLVSGNHDAASQISRTLSYPENVFVFGTHAPETAPPDFETGFAVHGQGYSRRDVTENLAVGYPAPVSGVFNIGLLHTALNGRDGHDPYAPCDEKELAALGYDYWALGHVHQREVVSKEPYIVFPGNIQGRHVKEPGPKGCTLVTVRPGHTDVEHRDLDVVRWAQVAVDAGGAADLDQVCRLAQTAIERARSEAAGRPLAARVTITGRSQAHAELWRERERLAAEVRGIAQGFGDVWVEKVRPATSPPQLGTDPSATGGGTGELVEGILRTARELRADEDVLREAIKGSELWNKLPPEARGRDRLDIADPQWCGQLLDEAAALLTAMLEERTG